METKLANGYFPSWEEWSKLTPDQREYSLYKTLEAMNSRMHRLETRGFINKVAVAVCGLIGGACAVLGREIFIK